MALQRTADLAEFKSTEASRKRFEDASLSSRVRAAMAKNPLTRSAGLEVTANDGAVVITGNVGSSKAVEAVAELAKVVPGVKSLRPDVGMGADWHLQRPTEYCRIKPRGISSAPGRRRLLTARS